MTEIKLETDELNTLAKQMTNESAVFSKRNDKIGRYAAELIVNCAFVRLGRIYDMIEEVSAMGSKRAYELKELANKAFKVQADFTKADDDGASIKAPSTEDDIQLGLSQVAGYVPFVNVINDASIAFTGKDIGGVGKYPDEIQEAKVWTMVNAGTFGLGGLEKEALKLSKKGIEGGWSSLMSAEDADKYNLWQKLRSDGYDILVDDYKKICKDSIHNSSSDTMTLGKYFPSVKADGSLDWSIPGKDSYTIMAGDTTYFSLGNDWDSIKIEHNMGDDDMFNLFNVPALDDAYKANKGIRFSHDPTAYGECALKKEWQYLKDKFGYTRLKKIGDFWYAK